MGNQWVCFSEKCTLILLVFEWWQNLAEKSSKALVDHAFGHAPGTSYSLPPPPPLFPPLVKSLTGDSCPKTVIMIPSTVAPSNTPWNLHNIVFPFTYQALPLLIRQFRNWLGPFFGLGYLNYFSSIQQILSGLVVSVVYWTIWVVGLYPAIFRISFFSFKLKRLALSWTFPAWNIIWVWYKSRKQFYLV